MKTFRKVLSTWLAFVMAFSMGMNSSTTMNLYAQEPDEIIETASEEVPSEPVEVPQIEQAEDVVEVVPEEVNDNVTDPEQAATEQETEPIEDEEEEEIEQEDEATYSGDLNQFANNITGPGHLEPGETGNFSIHFEETEDLQLYNSNLHYTFPDGFTGLPVSGTFNVNVYVGGPWGSMTVRGNTYSITENGIDVSFNQNDMGYYWLINAANVEFNIDFSGSISKDATFTGAGGSALKEVKLDDSNDLNVYKSANFDYNTNKVNYEVKVESVGRNTNVNVQDVITGSALTYNNDLTITHYDGSSVSYTGGQSGNGYNVTIGSMSKGETAVIKYTADVNFDQISGSKDEATLKSELNNTVAVKSDQLPNGKTAEAKPSISTTSISKSSATPKQNDDGSYTVEWTVKFNSDKRLNASGFEVKDTIDTNALKHAYDGKITVKQDGSEIASFDAESGSWKYTIPNTDKASEYTFTYQTKVDAETAKALRNDGYAKNKVTATRGNTSVEGYGQATIPPGQPIGVPTIVKKSTGKTDEEVTWQITIVVPKEGLEKAVVTDTLESAWINNVEYKDTLKSITVDDSQLINGESYSVDLSSGTVTFTQDGNPGLKASDSERTITITVVTEINQEWKKQSEETGQGTWHTNKGQISYADDRNPSGSQDSVEIGKKDPEPPVVETSITKDGEEYLSRTFYDGSKQANGYRFWIIVNNVDGDLVVDDTFDTSLLSMSGWRYIYDGSQHWPGDGSKTITFTPNSTGGQFTMSKEDLPKDADGNLYSSYRIDYFLELTATEAELEAAALANKGAAYLGNTAVYKELSATKDFTWKSKGNHLTKELLNKDEIDSENKTAKYKVTINPNGIAMNNGQPMDFVDTYNNLSIDYTTISIKDNNGNDIEGVTRTYKGSTITFGNIPDKTTVIITYDATVTKNDDNVVISNSIKWENYSDDANATVNVKSSGSGTASLLSIRILKIDKEHNEKVLPNVTFQLYKGNGNPVTGKNGNVYVTTNDKGVATVMGKQDEDGWTLWAGQTYYLVEVDPPTGYQKNDTKYTFTISKTESDYDK